MTEICKYEAEIATMGKSIEYILKGVNDLNEKQDELSDTLNGNGSIGLKTQTELNKAAIFRLWWTIPCMITLFGIIIGIVKYF